MTDNLYSWIYGKYEKEKFELPVVNSSGTYPGSLVSPSSGLYPDTVVYGYDLTVNPDGTFEKTNQTVAKINNSGYLEGNVNGKWVALYSNLNGSTKNYYHITNTGTQIWTVGSSNIRVLQLSYDKYYTHTNARWVERQGRILSTNINAYPNNDYVNGVYYGNRTKLL